MNAGHGGKQEVAGRPEMGFGNMPGALIKSNIQTHVDTHMTSQTPSQPMTRNSSSLWSRHARTSGEDSTKGVGIFQSMSPKARDTARPRMEAQPLPVETIQRFVTFARVRKPLSSHKWLHERVGGSEGSI